MTTFTIGTLFLILCIITNIFTITTTTYYYWRLKDMEATKDYYKGCTELYREVYKQDLARDVVDEYEQSLKDMFASFKKEKK